MQSIRFVSLPFLLHLADDMDLPTPHEKEEDTSDKEETDIKNEHNNKNTWLVYYASVSILVLVYYLLLLVYYRNQVAITLGVLYGIQ